MLLRRAMIPIDTNVFPDPPERAETTTPDRPVDFERIKNF